jgi:hypothetical protein
MASTETRAAANRTTRDLTDAQRRLIAVMSADQFGRIENLSVHAGQPVFDRDVRIVRVAPLGRKSCGTPVPKGHDFELKQAVCDLLDELTQLRDGTVVRLEFRHGLPCLLETTATEAQ